MSTPTAVADAELAKILRDNEDYILSVTKSKAVDLSEKMFQTCVISESMMDQFSSLDHSRVEPQLQLRYLLRLVTKRIKQDGSVGDKFVSILERKEHKLCEFMKISSTEKGMEPTKAEGKGLNKYLTTNDISWILEILAEASYKWEMLGIALGLPTYQIKNIKGDDNLKNLWRVLDVWLSGESNTPLTFSILISALRSKIVGQGRLAQEIEEKFISLDSPKTVLYSNITETSRLALTITNQSSREVQVEDKKSTLLLVQASHRENVSYQWNKDGRPLTDNHTYSGVQDNILIINHAHQGTRGDYTCIVSNQEKEAISNKVTLTVLYPPEKKALLDLYSVNTKASLDNAWPPVGAEIFINLVLVKTSRQSIGTNLTEVLDQREKIEYEEVFGMFRSAALILVEGRPGSGKTTLVHKLITDWAEGNTLVQANLVFLVSLRMLLYDGSQDKYLYTLLEHLYPNADADLISLISDIEKKNGKGACFVFDGLDEYHPHLEDKSVVFKLLHKSYLPRAMIIVSSRPGAMERLTPGVVTQHIEVFGFSENQISEYIDQFPFDTSSDLSFGPDNLKEYLKLHPNVFHMCYLPIHAAIICFVYQTNRGRLPHTQTKIYDEFTRSMILRHLKRNNREVQLFSLKELPDDTYDKFDKLCLLAFNMTVEEKQVIDAHDISFPLNVDTSPHGDWSLGLVTCNRTAQLYGVSTSYMFLHLTLQEYLTAYCIANTKEEEKYELIESLKRASVFGIYSPIIKVNYLILSMWTFYFGLNAFKSHESLEIYREIFLTDFLGGGVRYAFESQQQVVCNGIVRLHKNAIVMLRVFPSDVPALVFVMCNTTQPIRRLKLRISDSVTDSVLQLMKHVRCPQLEILEIDSIRVLKHSMILESSPQLRHAEFYFSDMTVEDGKYLADKFRHLKNLKHLRISGSKKNVDNTSPEVTAIVNGIHRLIQVRSLKLSFQMDLKCCSHLINMKALYLEDNNISSDGAINLGSALHHLINLEVLDVSRNNICRDGAIALVSALCNLTKFKELHLCCNNIGPDGAINLGWALHHLINLEVLDVNRNNICRDGATALVSALCNLTKFKALHLSHNNIGPDGAIDFASKLYNLTQLEELNLYDNNIGSDGILFLASGLCHLPKLNCLNLSGNGVDADSAKLVTTALKDCQKLEYVTLNDDNSM